MNKRNINAVIAKKMSAFWDSIEDEELRKVVEKETIVTGGCITSMLLNEPVTDYDIYLRNYDTVKAVADYYVDRFHQKRKSGIPIPISVSADGTRVRIVVQSSGIASEEGTEHKYQYFEGRPPEEAQDYVSEVMDNPETIEDTYEETQEQALEVQDKSFRPVFLTTNAITLSDKVQIVLRFYGEPNEIHENYDFIHCTNYWTKQTGVVLNQPALEAIINKELRYVGSKYPICSVIRTRKFLKKGWHINAGQYVKMCFQISQLDLNDISVLEDQLTGVDVAYFTQVIEKLREKGEDQVDSAYLVEIIDRMF